MERIGFLTSSNFSTVYYPFSLVIASMLFTAIFLRVSQRPARIATSCAYRNV